jgi:hypothetical protein
MPSPPRQGNRSRMFASVAPREVLARLRRGVAKPQVKLLIGVSDPYRTPSRPCHRPRAYRKHQRNRSPERDEALASGRDRAMGRKWEIPMPSDGHGGV